MTRGEVELEFFQKAGGLDEHIVMMMADEIVRLRQENDRLHQQYLTGCLEDRATIQQLRDANDRLREELAKPLTHEAIMKRVADDVGRVIANAMNNLPTEPPHA